jgi:cold shock protein
MKTKQLNWDKIAEAIPENFVKSPEPDELVVSPVTKSITHRGIIKFFNMTKGYGFIYSITDHKDYFVYKTGLLSDITASDHVTFRVDSFRGRPCAVEVVKDN